MDLFENIRESIRAIKNNLLRTILTGLIISIGIMSLVGILTAVDGMKHSLNQTFSSLGANSFDIRKKFNSGNGNSGQSRTEKVYPNITYDQAIKYKELMGEKAQVSLSANVSGATVVKSATDKTNPNINVIAGDEFYLAGQNLNLERGRSFSTYELELGTNVAIIGKEISAKLFPKTDPINQYITFLGRRFKIVGELEKRGSSMGGSGGDRMILIPLETGRQIPQAGTGTLTYNIKTSISRPEELTYVMGEATGVMRNVRQDRLGQEESFEIRRSDSLIQSLNEISGYLKVGGFVIGFITLLGASVGLMNIMMVSVNERTREIGVRKALGATAKQIQQQFLIEAIVICILGGIVGIFLGILMGNGIASLIGEGGFIVPWIWVFVGLSICVLVGVLSGFYPARRASKLDPIESLRYE
ncbi:ABC transporter permease [Pontibacter sp. HSC-36F09]|uniref:ABC transporter permease n=1 Tax=Pontibacter sp. HSC-36F09 TaxID=2910966 RepID=UPI0020A1B9ED|nr:ABC transporter permease [Pontibacter sp. HSC-36F09]MCP2044550.1 putative ABC transport system permease protein [Pontibacter sp. HSC-36F09]